MPILPMKQTVTVTPASSVDKWGRSVSGTPVDYKVRVEEKSELVADQAGKQAVSSLTIYFDKLVNITYNDVINYTNELGVTVKREPIKIDVIRGIGGKAVLTKVYI
jgi:hypothetical protein